MSRNTTILALIQVLLVVLGFFGLGIIMKISGYPNHDDLIQWNSLALLLRRNGFYLLILPLVWVSFTALSEYKGKFIYSYDVWCLIGILNAFLIISLFICACIFPYTRPIIIGFGH
jgi:hypothetical protein